MTQGFCGVRDEVAAGAMTTSNKWVEGFHMETFGAHNALHDVAQKTSVVIGVEAVLPENETKIVFNFPGGTVTDFLNAFVTQHPDYTWREVGASYTYRARVLVCR
jgi:hypothetical protein